MICNDAPKSDLAFDICDFAIYCDILSFRHLFGALRQKSFLRTWLKNSLRAAVVLLTAVVGRFAGPRWVP